MRRNTKPAGAGDRPEHPRTELRGVGFHRGFLLALPLAAALIVFVAQNTEQVTVRWTVWKVKTPLVVVVLVAITAAVVLAELVGVLWRHQRRRALTREAAPARPGAPPVGAPEPPAEDDPSPSTRAAGGEGDAEQTT